MAWAADDCNSELECALLTDVLGEVRYLTGKMRREADTQKVCSELGKKTKVRCAYRSL